MNELKVFENPEFGRVRTVSVDNEPWFFAKDVCDALSIATNHVRESLDEDEVSNLRSTEIGPEFGGKAPLIVSEAGLYSLILKSRKPEAKAFKRWITHEVIPAIRKTGGYHIPQSPAEQMAQGILAAQKLLAERDATIAKQNEQIAVLTPKGIFADAVTASKTSILVGGLAKLIKQQGIDIGQKRLFAWMRENGFLIKSGTGKGQVYFVNKFLNGSKAVLE